MEGILAVCSFQLLSRRILPPHPPPPFPPARSSDICNKERADFWTSVLYCTYTYISSSSHRSLPILYILLYIHIPCADLPVRQQATIAATPLPTSDIFEMSDVTTLSNAGSAPSLLDADRKTLHHLLSPFDTSPADTSNGSQLSHLDYQPFSTTGPSRNGLRAGVHYQPRGPFMVSVPGGVDMRVPKAEIQVWMEAGSPTENFIQNLRKRPGSSGTGTFLYFNPSVDPSKLADGLESYHDRWQGALTSQGSHLCPGLCPEVQGSSWTVKGGVDSDVLVVSILEDRTLCKIVSERIASAANSLWPGTGARARSDELVPADQCSGRPDDNEGPTSDHSSLYTG